jgi:L-iditol 2-dehydrogenase
MTTMRVAVLRGVGDLVVEERPAPRPGRREVVVKVSAVGVCGSDVHYYEHGRIGPHVVRAPLVLGHEPAGEVVGLGPGVTRLRVGQRVSIEPGVPCFRCRQCLAGHYNLCADVRFLATPPIDGAFCEYVAIHEAFAHPVPDVLSDDAAALLEPLSVGIWACEKGRVTAGSQVLVNGAGPIGLVAAQCARAFGATEVVVADLNPHRLALAAELGATATLDVRETPVAEAGIEAEVLLECTGQPAAIRDGVQAVGKAGRAVLVGMGGDEVSLPLAHLQNNEIELTGTFRYANTWSVAIALATVGEVALDRLVTAHFGLADAERALTAATTDPRSVKPVVVPIQ